MRELLLLGGALHFFLAGICTGRANSFGNVTMGGGGYVTGIITCPTRQNLIYAKTDVGGAYRWDESTKSWIPLLDWNSQSQTTYQGVESLAIDPSAPEKLYILAGTSYWNGGNTAILRSSDYGATFSVVDVTAKFKANGNGADRQKGETLAVDPNLGNILFCGTRANGLWKSTDSGVTWASVSSLSVGSSSISFVLFDKSSGTAGGATPRIFVGVFRTGSNLYVSNDGGTNWSAVAGSPTASLPERCSLAADGWLYITYGTSANGAIMKYNTSNGVWSSCTPAAGVTYCGISVSATNPQKLIATTYSIWRQQPWNWGDLIYVSSNGGTNWIDLFGSNRIAMNANGFPWIVGSAIHWAGTIELDPFNSDRVFVGSGNGIFSTENRNSGQTVSTWKFMVKGFENTVPADFLSVSGGPLLTSMYDIGGFVHTNIAVSPGAGNISQSSGFAYAWKKPGFIARVAMDLYYSQNNGASWTKMPRVAAAMTNGLVAISADGASVLWKLGSTNKCYVTTDKGVTWTETTGLTFTCNPVGDPENASKFFAYNPSDGYAYSSSDGGRTFARAASVGTGGASVFRVAPGFEGHLWIAMGGGGLKHLTNSGAVVRLTSVSVCDAVAIGKTIPGASYPTLFIWGRPATSSITGMYHSTDQGATWTRVNDDAHQYGGRGNAGLIEGDKNVLGRVYMSSAGRGVVYMDAAVPAPPLAISAVDSTAAAVSWPDSYAGWILQAQTNTAGAGLSTNWSTLPVSTGTNRVFIPLDSAAGSAFYRLYKP